MSKYSQAGHGSSSTFLMRSRRGFFWAMPAAVRKAMPGMTVWSSFELERAEQRDRRLFAFAEHEEVDRRLLHRKLRHRREVLAATDDRHVRERGLHLVDQLAHDRPAVAPHAGDADRLHVGGDALDDLLGGEAEAPDVAIRRPSARAPRRARRSRDVVLVVAQHGRDVGESERQARPQGGQAVLVDVDRRMDQRDLHAARRTELGEGLYHRYVAPRWGDFHRPWRRPQQVAPIGRPRFPIRNHGRAESLRRRPLCSSFESP
jgi:hypothetical protein